MTFRIGQKVVCVDDFWEAPPAADHLIRPQKDQVYTVRDLAPGWISSNGPAIRLEEIINRKTLWQKSGFCELAFKTSRFRPLVERKTDISIFTAMLTPSPKYVKVKMLTQDERR